MSKSTKIIAALGVVAGLGVAALPMATYADQTGDPVVERVAGDVDVVVEVQDAIAMTIVGNNDDSSHYGTMDDPETSGVDESTYGQVKVKSPSAVNKIGTTVLDDFQYYDATTAAANIKASSSYAALLPNAVVAGLGGSGTGANGFMSTITVYTNATAGYNLTLKDADATTALTQQVVSGTADTIPATSATTLTAGTAAWGYRVVDAEDATSGDWLAVPASTATTAAAINSSATATTGGDTTYVQYGVATRADQKTGIYKDTITYTATTNN